MKNFIFRCLLFLILLFYFNSPAEMAGQGYPDNLGTPIIMEPAGEQVDLTGKDSLLFKWYDALFHYPGNDYYDFRIYRGYQTLEETLILTERVPANTFQISVTADLFKSGEVYTCAIRHVVGAAKSSRGYKSFQVTK